jgi:hypothetical protein
MAFTYSPIAASREVSLGCWSIATLSILSESNIIIKSGLSSFGLGSGISGISDIFNISDTSGTSGISDISGISSDSGFAANHSWTKSTRIKIMSKNSPMLIHALSNKPITANREATLGWRSTATLSIQSESNVGFGSGNGSFDSSNDANVVGFANNKIAATANDRFFHAGVTATAAPGSLKTRAATLAASGSVFGGGAFGAGMSLELYPDSFIGDTERSEVIITTRRTVVLDIFRL